MEATKLKEEVDELKSAVDRCVGEGTAVLPDDEFAEKTAVDGVDTVNAEGLVMGAEELIEEVGTNVVEFFVGLVAQEESLRYPLTASAYGVPLIELASEAVAS